MKGFFQARSPDERSDIRGGASASKEAPDFAELNPGYKLQL